MNRCVGEQMCAQLQQLAASANQPYRVRLYRSGRIENHTIAQYSEKSEALLQAKLAQFTRGTSFVLAPDALASKEQRTLEDHAKALFDEAGMSLVVEHQ